MRKHLSRLLLFFSSLLLLSSLAAQDTHAQAVQRRPVLVGKGEARAEVERAWSRPPAKRAARAWAADAWESLRREGWLWARVALSAGGDSLYLDAGRQARIASVIHSGADSLQWERFAQSAEIVPGALYRPGRWEAQCARGLARLGDTGYPYASVTVRELQADAERGEVYLELLLLTGEPASIGAIIIEGATHTRPDILARLSGLRTGQSWSEERLELAAARLEARYVVERVVEAGPLLASPDGSVVDLRMLIEQPRSTGRASAAIGVLQDKEDGGTRIYGTADLALLDLFGTARQLHGHFLDDGLARRTLDLSYLEPLIFGSPFDLRVALGSRHEDLLYDTVLGDLGLRLPWRGATELELGGGVDRTSFVGQQGRLRTRRRAAFRFRASALRPNASGGLYGSLDSRLAYALVSQTFANPEPDQEKASTSKQTIVDGDLRLGVALGRNLAFAVRGRFASVLTDDLPIPVSEQFFIGGATTVRGHREDERHGETISHGSLEMVLGPARGGQAYVFYDLGWWRDTFDLNGQQLRQEGWMRGFGLGLRTPAPFGRLDLSLGFAERLSFDDGLIHLALISEF